MIVMNPQRIVSASFRSVKYFRQRSIHTLVEANINVLKMKSHGTWMLFIPLSTLVYKYARLKAPNSVVMPDSINTIMTADGWMVCVLSCWTCGMKQS